MSSVEKESPSRTMLLRVGNHCCCRWSVGGGGAMAMNRLSGSCMEWEEIWIFKKRKKEERKRGKFEERAF
jgi:hypothetical protein